MKPKSKWFGKTGLETLNEIIHGNDSFDDPMGKTLNLSLVFAEEGKCVFEGKPKQQHLNPRGVVHGGWTMSILDAAAVLSVVSTLPKGKMCATSTFEVKFIRPVRSDMTCRAEGKIIAGGTNLAHAKAKLIDVKTGKLLAFCTCSASVFDIDG